MTTVIALNTLVWLKQPGYPWWPGMVMDPTSLEMELPAGCDTCVLCLPSASSSVAFASATNTDEIVRFTPPKDDLLIQEGKQHAECAAAIEEALSIHMQQERQKQKQQKQQQAEHEESSQERSNARRAPAHGRGEGHKPKTEKRRRDESPKSRRRLRTRHEEENDKKDVHKSQSTHHLEKYDDDDVYEREALREPQQGMQEADAAYLEAVLRQRRQPASDSTLESTRHRLDALHGRVHHPISDAVEDELLDLLSPLTMMSVTLDQLRRVKIGVAVGNYVSDKFPARVGLLATAILRFWFRQLPAATQQRLSVQTEVEDASNETTAGSDIEGVGLSAFGMQLEDCFTDAEVNDTIHNPAKVARAIEKELSAANEDLRIATLQIMRSADNEEIRRALLEGRLSARELVEHAPNPESFMLLLSGDGTMSSVASPLEPESPLNPRSAFENFTTLYACPSCGVREAVANEYSVQAHDNMSTILRCLKCGETWNSEV